MSYPYKKKKIFKNLLLSVEIYQTDLDFAKTEPKNS